MTKYGELNAKQKRMLAKYFVKNFNKHTAIFIDYDGMEEIFQVRPSEFFYTVADHIIDDWKDELAHDGKLHTARIDDCGNGEMDKRTSQEIECESGDFDVCSFEKTTRFPHGICVNCGQTWYHSERNNTRNQTEQCLIGI